MCVVHHACGAEKRFESRSPVPVMQISRRDSHDSALPRGAPASLLQPPALMSLPVYTRTLPGTVIGLPKQPFADYCACE